MQASGRKIAVLGATGRLGRMLFRAPAASAPAGPVVQLFAHSRRSGHAIQWDPQEHRAPADVLAGLLRGMDVVVNLTGSTPTSGGTADQFDAVNVGLAETIVRAARAAGVPRILMASSASVYGRPRPEQAPFKETDAVAPLTQYGQSKARMEERLLALAADQDDVSILRFGNIAGADALLGQLTRQAKPVSIALDLFTSGGGPVRSYLGPHGLYRAVVALATAPGPLPPVMNVAHPVPVRMEALLTAWQAVDPLAVEWSFRPAPAGAIERVVLDTGRLGQVVRFDAADPAEAIVRECIAHCRGSARGAA